MEHQEFTRWIVSDTLKQVGKYLLIFGVLLGAYWLT